MRGCAVNYDDGKVHDELREVHGLKCLDQQAFSRGSFCAKKCAVCTAPATPF